MRISSVIFISCFIFLLLPCGRAQDSAKGNIVSLNMNAAAKPANDFNYHFRNAGLQYIPQKKFSFITALPKDFARLGSDAFSKKSLVELAVIAASTAILIPADQSLIDGARNFSDNIHLHPETDYIEVLKLGDIKVFRLPKNINTALYQSGQGFTTMILAGGLYTYGLIAKDYRSKSVAAQLTESFIMMGLATQVLKRISGRESPFVATRSGGAWRPFPSFSEFQQNTPNYDAFPSGHLATLMSAVTILAENYPEKKWIKPLGYSIMFLSSFAMMNTEVHWLSDYPLALGLGYLCGKIVAARHVKKIRHQPVALWN